MYISLSLYIYIHGDVKTQSAHQADASKAGNMKWLERYKVVEEARRAAVGRHLAELGRSS